MEVVETVETRAALGEKREEMIWVTIRETMATIMGKVRGTVEAATRIEKIVKLTAPKGEGIEKIEEAERIAEKVEVIEDRPGMGGGRKEVENTSP